MKVEEGTLLWTPLAGAHRALASDALPALARRARPPVRRLRGAVALVRRPTSTPSGRPDRDFCGIESSTPPTARARQARPCRVRSGSRARTLNYAQHALRHERPGDDALLYLSERRPLTAMSWEELARQVRVLATQLRKLGVKPGDRVVAYLPNMPEAMIAMLATTSIGAVWSSCGPDFGTRGVLDRFSQLAPKVIFCVDGYQYGGKPFDRRAEVREIIGAAAHARARDPRCRIWIRPIATPLTPDALLW